MKTKEAKDKKTKKTKNENYFSEKEITKLVKEYKVTKSDEVFEEMSKPIYNMINGMINKEFYYNSIVKDNREDIQTECFFEILKSLEKYDPDRGRVFAYFNRIVKNTILRCYNKIKKINSKELLYTNFSKNVADELDDDTVLNLGKKTYRNMETFSEQETLQALDSKKTLTAKESYFVIYKYIKSLKNNISIYTTDVNLRKDLLVDIKTDPNVSFDFSKYSKSSLISDYIILTRIMVAIDITLLELLSWLSKKYPSIDKIEPKTFNAKIQLRTINAVKNYVNNTIEHSKLTEYYDIDDIIKLISYIIDRNIKLNLG